MLTLKYVPENLSIRYEKLSSFSLFVFHFLTLQLSIMGQKPLWSWKNFVQNSSIFCIYQGLIFLVTYLIIFLQNPVGKSRWQQNSWRMTMVKANGLFLYVYNRGDAYYSITPRSREGSLFLTPRQALSSHQHRTLVYLF